MNFRKVLNQAGNLSKKAKQDDPKGLNVKNTLDLNQFHGFGVKKRYVMQPFFRFEGLIFDFS
jgi:hypothetical protein